MGTRLGTGLRPGIKAEPGFRRGLSKGITGESSVIGWVSTGPVGATQERCGTSAAGSWPVCLRFAATNTAAASPSVLSAVSFGMAEPFSRESLMVNRLGSYKKVGCGARPPRFDFEKICRLTGLYGSYGRMKYPDFPNSQAGSDFSRIQLPLRTYSTSPKAKIDPHSRTWSFDSKTLRSAALWIFIFSPPTPIAP